MSLPECLWSEWSETENSRLYSPQLKILFSLCFFDEMAEGGVERPVGMCGEN